MVATGEQIRNDVEGDPAYKTTVLAASKIGEELQEVMMTEEAIDLIIVAQAGLNNVTDVF